MSWYLKDNMGKSIHLSQLLEFFDYKVKESETHASAINSVLGEELAAALMVHFFVNQGYDVTELALPCTTGSNRGFRLDKWISLENNSAKIIYQCEIKNWNAHSYKGKVVKRNGDDSYMKFFRIDRWKFQFDIEKKIPTQKETLKVLTKMRIPTSHASFDHRTLLCFWEPLHPMGLDEPFFVVDVINNDFNKMYVFSLSNYVRLLLKSTETLELDMKKTDQRLEWLNKIYC